MVPHVVVTFTVHSHSTFAITKVPQYTFSRVRRQYDKATVSESGSGWSREGLQKLMRLPTWSKKIENFAALHLTAKCTRCSRIPEKVRLKAIAVDKKQRPLIYDDMDNEDNSGQEDTNEHVSFVRV